MRAMSCRIALLVAVCTCQEVFGARIKRKKAAHGVVETGNSMAELLEKVHRLSENSEAMYQQLSTGLLNTAIQRSGDARALSGDVSTIKTIAENALFIFQKAVQSAHVYTQWQAVTLALNETKLAAYGAVDAVPVLVEKIINATIMFASSGLTELAAKVHNEIADEDMDMLGAMFERTTDDGTPEFERALRLFRSCTIELSDIADVADAVVDVIEGLKGLMSKVSVLTEAYVDVDMSIFDPLKTQVEVAKDIIIGLVQTVEKQVREASLMAREWAFGHYDDFKRKFKDRVSEFFGDLGLEIQAINVVIELVVAPLVQALARGIRTLVDIAQDYTLPEDAPDSVAPEKVDYWESCSWRQIRWFDSIEDVDIENTMVCEMVFFRRYRCQCIARNDCYVSKFYRPFPKAKKRCFNHTVDEEDM